MVVGGFVHRVHKDNTNCRDRQTGTLKFVRALPTSTTYSLGVLETFIGGEECVTMCVGVCDKEVHIFLFCLQTHNDKSGDNQIHLWVSPADKT